MYYRIIGAAHIICILSVVGRCKMIWPDLVPVPCPYAQCSTIKGYTYIYISPTEPSLGPCLCLWFLPSWLKFSRFALRFLELRRWYSFAANSTIAGNSFWWGGDPKHILLLESPYRSRSRFYWLAWLILATVIIIENLPRQICLFNPGRFSGQVWAPRQTFRKGGFDAKMT